MFTKVLNSFTFLKLNKLSLESFLKFGGLITAAVVGFFFTGVINIIRKLSHQYRWKNSQNRIILASYNFCRSAIVIIFFALQFAGALAMLSLTLYWYMEGVFLSIVIVIGLYIFSYVYCGILAGLGVLFRFLLDKAFHNPDAVLFQLYYIFLFLYAIVFVTSFCIKVYYDLIHFGGLNKLFELLPSVMPTVHAMSPEKQSTLIELFRKYYLAKAMSFDKKIDYNQAITASNLHRDAVTALLTQELIENNNLLETVAPLIKRLLSAHLTDIMDININLIKEAFPQTDSKMLALFKILQLKSFSIFIFKHPSIFPSLQEAYCTDSSVNLVINSSYEDIYDMCNCDKTRLTSARINFLTANANFRHNTANESVLGKLQKLVTYEQFIRPVPILEAIEEKTSVSSDTHLLPAVEESISSSSNFDNSNFNSSSVSSNFLILSPSVIATNDILPIPQTTVLSAAAPQFIAKSMVTHSVITSVPLQLDTAAEAVPLNTVVPSLSQIEVISELDEATKKRIHISLDKLSATMDNTGYLTRFWNWCFSANLSDQEYINNLYSTTNVKTQERMLAGLDLPPENPKRHGTFLFPEKWCFVGEELRPNGTDLSVKFAFDEGKFGISVNDSHDARWQKFLTASGRK